MNESIYIAHLKAYKSMLSLPHLAEKTKNKSDNQQKTIWLGVREISPVSIYGGVYGGEDLRRGVYRSYIYISSLWQYHLIEMRWS